MVSGTTLIYACRRESRAHSDDEEGRLQAAEDSKRSSVISWLIVVFLKGFLVMYLYSFGL